MSLDYISIIATVLTSAVITLIASVLYSNLKRNRYDQERNRIVLESIRESLEKQIYGLNEKLIKSEERWKDVNHLLLRKEYLDNTSSFNTNTNVQFNNFLKSNGISEKEIKVDKKLIFVLTPFHEEFQKDYEIIKSVCHQVGLTCVRGDETFFNSDIFSQMLKYIVNANLVIANINGRNPNVLYELGIAQALDKPVILISRRPENLPIDIRSKRFIIYKDYTELSTLIKDELIKVLTM